MRRVLLLVLLAASALYAQPKKVVVMGMSEAQVAELRDASPPAVNIVHITNPRSNADVVAIVADSPEQSARKQALFKEVADADAIIGAPSGEVINAAKKLKWLQITSAGVAPYLTPEVVNSDIVMTNAKTLSAPAIADHGFGMLLALTRNLNHFIAAQSAEKWDRKNYELQELEGKTALVVGTGGIGSQVARRAKAFGMTVIGVDPKEFPPRLSFDKMVYPDRLDQVIPEADVVFLCVPHTKESEKMYGPSQFERMKRGSYFIALSRGKVYDLGALVKALDSKHLAGAGVDVTDPEPLPKGNALWGFDNVIITPHVATQGEGGTLRRIELYNDNIARFAAGEQLLNVVDKKKGY
jgi:phosphoglycerate dehydrogenase-like enzyme